MLWGVFHKEDDTSNEPSSQSEPMKKVPLLQADGEHHADFNDVVTSKDGLNGDYKHDQFAHIRAMEASKPISFPSILAFPGSHFTEARDHSLSFQRCGM